MSAGDEVVRDGSGGHAIDRCRLTEAAERALDQFTALSGFEPESVTGVKQVEDGWSLLVDVVEVERVPSTMSILASYRVDTDARGDLVAYERLRRFTRVTAD
ncbi:MAG TPA: gas vesicle protein [Kofleriaceae bacterium]|nr:gas vesicle protein [Kofleriaceae bacterium]